MRIIVACVRSSSLTYSSISPNMYDESFLSILNDTMPASSSNDVAASTSRGLLLEKTFANSAVLCVSFSVIDDKYIQLTGAVGAYHKFSVYIGSTAWARDKGEGGGQFTVFVT